MPGQPMPDAPLQTLETRLERVERLIEELRAYVADADVGRDRRALEIRERLDLQFMQILRLLDEIRLRTSQ